MTSGITSVRVMWGAIWPVWAMVAAVYLGFLIYPGEYWWATPFGVWSWMGVPVVLVGPLLTGGACWWVQRVRRLVQSGAWRPTARRREIVLALGPLALAALLIHLVVTAIAVTIGAVWGGGVDGGYAGVLLPQLAVLLMFLAFGAALGCVWASPLAAPAGAIALFLVPVLFYTRLPSSLLVIGGGQLSPGMVPDWRFVLAQAVWAGGLGLAALPLVSLRPRGGVARSWVVGGVGGAMALAGSLTLLAGGVLPARPGGETGLTCDDGRPVLCLSAVSEPQRAVTRTALERLSSTAQEWRLPVPSVVAEAVPGAEPPDGARVLSIVPAPGMGADDVLADVSFVAAFLGDEGCLAGADSSDLDRLLLALQALQRQALGVGIDDDVDTGRLRDSAEGRAWISHTLQGFVDCQLDGLSDPP